MPEEIRLQVRDEILSNRPDLANARAPGTAIERILIFWSLTDSVKGTARKSLSTIRREDPEFVIRATPATTIDRDFRPRSTNDGAAE